MTVARGLAQVGDQLGDLAREGLGLGGPVERLAEPVGGDQLHRPRDLADVLDRLAALDDRSGLGHRWFSFRSVAEIRGSISGVAATPVGNVQAVATSGRRAVAEAAW